MSDVESVAYGGCVMEHAVDAGHCVAACSDEEMAFGMDSGEGSCGDPGRWNLDGLENELGGVAHG